MYPLEAREDAARRVQILLGLAQTQNFIEEQNLPNNIVRYMLTNSNIIWYIIIASKKW